MKTIMQVHILVRLFGLGLIMIGLYRIPGAILALNKLKEVQEKQKEMMGQEFELFDLFPTFTEMLFEPVVFVVVGTCLFLLVKTVVRFIIGKEQIEALLKLDRTGGQNQSR